MRCPNCNYKHGWNGKSLTDIKGEHGAFFILSNDVMAERRNFGEIFSRDVYFCPKCGLSFIKTPDNLNPNKETHND